MPARSRFQARERFGRRTRRLSYGRVSDGSSPRILRTSRTSPPYGALLEALSGCQALVTRGMGPRLVSDLNSKGIAAHVCDVEDVAQAARLFAKGQLTRVEGGGACHRP
jgi:hypothetical protein